MRRQIVLLGSLFLGIAACGSPEEPDDSLSAYGDIETTNVIEPVAYSDTPYDFTGPTPIGSATDDVMDGSLHGIVNDALPSNPFVWVGTAPNAPFPFGDDDCNPDETFETRVAEVGGLPVEIEGIVTIHPRYQITNLQFCGSRERFYGSYFIQDETGGVLVLKDSRIADFRMGDRVRVKANTMSYNFGAYAVLGHTDQEIISRDHEVFFEDIGEDNLSIDHLGKTVRIRRQLVSAASNVNFSEMCLIPPGAEEFLCSDACIAQEQCVGQGSPARPLLVSLDREIEQRDPLVLEEGDMLEITGPVTNSFGLRILVARAGQLSIISE